MKKNSNIVQTVVLVVFGLGMLLGVLFFSGKIKLPWDKESETGITGSVTIWGVLPYRQVKGTMDTLEQQNDGLRINYLEKKPASMQNDLVNALASGKGPDLFMMSPGEVAENLDRLYIVPYTAYSETLYKSNFIDAADIFLTKNGILAFPVFINPMVMYYNRDILTSNYITQPPTTWEELEKLAPTLSVKDDAGKIKQSMVAFGTTNNTSYPFDILLLKIFQAGNPIIYPSSDGWTAKPNINNSLGNAISWYINFSNTTNSTYSWNQSLPKDRDFFTAGNLVFYFGYLTEYPDIREKNPNLNFGVTMVPQISDTAKKVDYGQMYSIGISKISKNLSGAIGVANLLTSKELAPRILGINYAPVRRDLLAQKPKDDAEKTLLFNSAIISKTFFDPDASQTNKLLLKTVDQINAGTRDISSGIEAINSSLQTMVNKLKLPTVKAVP